MSAGETLEQLLRERGLNQTEAASKIGITRQYLNSVINGKLPLTTELQWKLKPVVGKGLEYWAEVSNKFDTYVTTPEGRKRMLEAREEGLVQQFDLHGQHVLVNYEIEAAVEAQMIQFQSLDGRNLFKKERLGDTLYQLTFSDEAKVVGTDHVTRFVNTVPYYDLLPGERLSMPTAEIVSLSHRIRMHVHGLCDPLPEQFVQLIGADLVEPRSASQCTLRLMHSGWSPARIAHGDSAVLVSFEYLAAEPTRPPRVVG